jgi:RNA polymerase sigma-70 factor (ECF subfamily)
LSRASIEQQPAEDVAVEPTEQAEATGPTDQELVEAIRDSDQLAFNLLYERYFQRIYNFSFARLRDHSETEEVVQETFTSVYRSAMSYRGDSHLVSWIYGIARNTINNHLRRARTYELRIEQARPELARNYTALSSATPEDNLNLQRCADAIREQLESVSDWQAQIFVLRHMENLPIGEIATRTSRSNDAVRSSLYRVKRLLVESVGRDFDPGVIRRQRSA